MFRRSSILALALVIACTDKGGGDHSGDDSGDGGGGDGGGADGGAADGGGADGGATEDACDEHPGELLCLDGVAVTCDAEGDVLRTEECGEDSLCQEGTGCVSCAVELDAGLGPLALDSALVRLDPRPVDGDWAWRRAGLRPVQLGVDPELQAGTVHLGAVGEGLAWYDQDGNPLAFPLAIEAADLPLTLLAQGLVDAATATVTGRVDGCSAAPAVAELRVAPWVELGGRALPGFPWLERVDAFTFLEQPQVGVDSTLHGDLAGREADLYVVAHRDPVAWGEDPALVDAGDGAETVLLSGEGLAADTWTAWATDLDVTPGRVADAWDLVLDLDRDGTLSPGDLFEGPDQERPAFWALGDLSQRGPYKATATQYSGGIWLGQRTYWPAEIDAVVAEKGLRPLVVISHGNGHDYRWYDYLGYHLASWGFVVMVHQNNTGPGIDTCSMTTLTNTEYFVEHLSTIADGVLDGQVDVHRMAWIGHSRGGEGVARAYDRLLEGDLEDGVVIDGFTVDDVVLISSIAPTVFLGVTDSDPHDRWYHLIAGAADGDVTGGPASGVTQYLRIAEAAEAARAVTIVQGASHNDFNCCGFDDGTGPDLIGREAAQILARSHYMALLTWVMEGDPATADLVRRQWSGFHDGGIADELQVATQYLPAPAARAVVIDDFQSGESVEESSAGTLVSATVEALAEGILDDADGNLSWTGSDPMNGMTLAEDADDLSRGAVFSWQEEATWRVAVAPGEQDWTGHTWLSLRACQGTRHPNTVALEGPLTFSVALVDALGNESVVALDDLGLAVPPPYPRDGAGLGVGWSNEWSTLRLRIADFASAGAVLDLSQVVAVELRLGEAWGSPMGRLGMDDLILVDE